MNARLTTKEWELLSAYLDDQLSGTEKRQVAQLLAQRAEFSQGLEELRRTRAILKAAPRRRAPRNFTLSPAMVGQTRRTFTWGWAPSFGVASALATLFLVLSFFLQSTFRLAPALLQAPMANRQSAPATEATPLILWGPGNPPQGLGGGLGAGSPTEAASESLPAATPAALAASPLLAATVTAPPASAALSSEASRTATPAPDQVSKAAQPQAHLPTAAAAQLDSSQGPILGVAPTEERGKMLVPSQEPVRVAESTARGSNTGWIWLQAGLGVTALAFGLAALLVWRRSRH